MQQFPPQPLLSMIAVSVSAITVSTDDSRSIGISREYNSNIASMRRTL